jgi:hypothetical protein
MSSRPSAAAVAPSLAALLIQPKILELPSQQW